LPISWKDVCFRASEDNEHFAVSKRTGNVGVEVIKYLNQSNHTNKVVAGVRDINKTKIVFNK
jgi:hypothetical protein